MNLFRGALNIFGKAEAAPKQEIGTAESQVEEHWKHVCNRTLINTPESLRAISHHLCEILTLLQHGIENNSAGPILNVMNCHEIPKRLVEFAYGNSPRGLINEVIRFFRYFGRAPWCTLLHYPFIINPLNRLLENDMAADANLFTSLVQTFLTHFAENPETLHLFYVSETSAPLIHQFSQLLISQSPGIGGILIQILVGANKVEGLLDYIITSSPLVSMLADILSDAIVNKKSSPEICEFLEYVNTAVKSAPQPFVAALETTFSETVVKPMIIEASSIKSIKNAIYLLASFTAKPLISSVVDFEMKNLQQYLTSEDENVVILAIRLASLMFEKFEVKLPAAPASIKISPDFIRLINSEWFIRERLDISKDLQAARSRVSMSLSGIPKEDITFDVTPILPILINIMDNFVDNSVRMNLTITEFFAAVASTWGHEATFFALSHECECGLFKSISSTSVVFERRVGKRPGTIHEIERAYETIDKELDPEQKLYHNLVVFLEFLKELDATAQTKNILQHQRNSIIIE